MADKGSPLRRISLAWGSSRFSRSSAFMRSVISVETPARPPLSISARLHHSFNVCAAQPIFGAIATIAAQREPRSASLSKTIRTARADLWLKLVRRLAHGAPSY